MNLDITFCSNINCKNVNCERNQKTLIITTYMGLFAHPISIANFENCEFWEVKGE